MDHEAATTGSLNWTEMVGRAVVTVAPSAGVTAATVGPAVSSTTVTLTGAETSPTPLITRTQIVFVPSPGGRVHSNSVRSGSGGRKLCPSWLRLISVTVERSSNPASWSVTWGVLTRVRPPATKSDAVGGVGSGTTCTESV